MNRFLNFLIIISLVVFYGCSVKSLGNPSFQFHMLKGKEFHHSNQFDKAIDEYQKAVKLNPNSEEEKGKAERFLPEICSFQDERHEKTNKHYDGIFICPAGDNYF